MAAVYKKLQAMLVKAVGQAASDLGVLLGQDLGCGKSSIALVSRADYLKKLENAAFFVGMEAKEEYDGRFHVIVALRDAIVLGATMLGIPTARINEKKRLAIVEPDDIDAFNEIANQLTGSFNSALKPSLPKKIHLKQIPPYQHVPESTEVNDTLPVPDGKYALFRLRLTLDGHDLDPLEILVPEELANVFDSQADAPELEEEEEVPEAPPPPVPLAVLVLEDNLADRQDMQDLLAAAGMRGVPASLSADIPRLVEENDVKAVVIGIMGIEDRDLSICQRISNAVGEMPIMISSRQWTRSAVLKALKYGARDIVAKNYTRDEMTKRVKNLLQPPVSEAA